MSTRNSIAFVDLPISFVPL